MSERLDVAVAEVYALLGQQPSAELPLNALRMLLHEAFDTTLDENEVRAVLRHC